MSTVARKEKVQDPYQAVESAYRSSKKKLGQEYFVIDCDRHIIEPPEAFTMYLDKEWKAQAPKLTTDNTGAPRLMVEGRLYQKPVGWGPGRTEGCGDQRPRGEGLAYERAHKHAFENRDIDMDMSGIDAAVWIPTLGLFIPDIMQLEFQYAVARALNDWTAKVWSSSQRHMWCVTIPHQPGVGGGGDQALQEARSHRGLDAPQRDAGRALVGPRLGPGVGDHDQARHGPRVPRGDGHLQRDLQHRLQVRQVLARARRLAPAGNVAPRCAASSATECSSAFRS